MAYRNRIAYSFVFIALGYLLGAGGLFAQNQDVILRKDTGKRMTVTKVTAETYLEVRYKRGSADGKIDSNKVEEIIYYDVPESFKKGLSFLKSGEFENAESSFRLAMEEKNVRSWIKTYGLYHLGRTYQRWGIKAPEKTQSAIDTYTELLKVDPETRFYPEALLNLARCHSDSKNLEAAGAAFDRLASEAYEKKLGVQWEALAKLEKAVSLMEGGRLDDAERELKSAVTFASDRAASVKEDPALVHQLENVAGMAKLYQGTVMIRKKKIGEAGRFYQEIIDDPGASREAKANAACGLGECLLAEKKVKEAQSAFAEARALYFDIPEAAAHATYALGHLCLELKEDEPNYKKRAREYFEIVLDRHPDSEWAKKARIEVE